MTSDHMGHTLEKLASLVDGRVVGNADLHIKGVATLAHAKSDELGLLSDRKYLKGLSNSNAGALLVSRDIDPEAVGSPNLLVVDDPRNALAVLIEHFHPEPDRIPGIHPTAVIGERVQFGVNISVGPYVVVGNDVVIGDRVTLHAHVVVQQRARIGNDSTLHPHVVLYPEVQLGNRVILHAGVRVGVDGFGYTPSDGEIKKIPHVGLCLIGDDVEIGANSCVDRGTIGNTEIGNQTKLDNLVHIAHNVKVGSHNLMAAMVGIAGSTVIGDDTMWGGQSGAMGHLEIGDGIKVAAQAGLTNDVSSGSKVAGFPARPIKDFLKANAVLYRIADLRRRVLKMERSLGLDPNQELTE
tara:strand:- start:197 stop:1255 length:1059 start_codon:yes stop_codon:yes gene_type:complete